MKGYLDDSDKMYAEVLREELTGCRRIETWGASLFVGAIGLVAKQLIEWDKAADPRHALLAWAFMAPALLGLMAFVLGVRFAVPLFQGKFNSSILIMW
ncbi:hypothetical protein COU79_00755 [Candidatus Peregrinibacteria bacterium CG10_big_fil_rev_8_21_14_0_10_54_7]|nr:MAG: hypothetical protein COU79_00755 [Candidatus Peregrinibacteria bacterium CG10_big_fil_rev_8_21_14_0_10_54_7]